MNPLVRQVERIDHALFDGTLRRTVRNADRMLGAVGVETVGRLGRARIARQREKRLAPQEFIRPVSLPRFIGGTTGRSGTKWLVRVLKAQFRSEPVVMDEVGVFVLSLIRHAPYEYYQLGIDDSVEKRANYVKYFLKQVHRYAFKRRNIYGSGMLGLVDYVPRRAIVKAGEALKTDLPSLTTLPQITRRFGDFYLHLLNYHAAIVHGSASSWINKEPPYGRHADELLRMIPNAKLLILARDGRATALSMFKRRWMSSVRACMDRWGEFSGMTLEAVKRAPADRVMVLPYREMVRNFEESLTTVHSFLELPAPDFDRLRDNPDGTLFPQTNSLDRWKQEIDTADIEYFDSTYGSIMDALELRQ
ncbi:MAG: sulfotransferase [Spirochaetales bacterium]|nr:sulfotransferase [Spirochaetales bacterium]